MKKSAIFGTVAAAVVVAGGAVGGYALTQDQPAPEPTVQAVETTAPDATETTNVEPTNTPTEIATPKPTAEPAYTEEEQIFLPWARQNYESYRATSPRLPEMTDADMLAALYAACDAVAAEAPIGQTLVLPGFESVDDLDPSTGEDDANYLFLDAADLGYGPNITGTAGSYCD